MAARPNTLRIHGQLANPQDEVLRKAPILFSMGFRVFFLSAALYVAVATAMWLHTLATGRNPSGGALPINLWHAHEMIFGFTLAVVAGFVLTAARTWTGRNTSHGTPLLVLWLLWLGGRAHMMGLLPLPGILAAALHAAFPLLLVWQAGQAIFASRSTRNYGVVAALGALAVAAAGTQLEAAGLVHGTARPSIYGALHLLVLLNVVIGARIIPLFTRNRTGVQTIRKVPALDRVATAAAVAVIPVAVLKEAFGATAGWGWIVPTLAGVAAVSGVLQLVRMATWGTLPAMKVPLLAVLHVGYAWIGVGQLLLAASLIVPGLSPTVALHALTVGTIGMMTLGMMARVTLGHTGRPIVDRPAHAVAFGMMALAGLVRLSAEVVPAQLLTTTWALSGALFVASYLIYVVIAWVPLTTPRPDGKAG